jgi:integrase
MRLVEANGRSLILTHAGELHGPFTLFINVKYGNPNTRTAVTGGLRLLQVFVQAFSVPLPHRALEGHCLHPQEVGWLANLAYRPLEEIESMTPQMLSRLVKTEVVAHRDRTGAVAGATASARLVQIAIFLDWYFVAILDPRIRSAQARSELRDRYEVTINDLKSKIKGSNSKHPTQIRSLPSVRFKQLMTAAYSNPEAIFGSGKGANSTLKRDRAVFLLACEGLRPGAIGNLLVADFNGRYLEIKDNVGKRGEAPTSGTPVQKGARSNAVNYNSEYTLTLWPWTTEAISDYIRSERSDLLARRLKNPSKGFLFLEALGAGPIRNRKTISLIFKKAAARMKELGLLTRESGDAYVKAEDYELVAYTLRHSAATLYAAEKGASDSTRSEMKDRFGWTSNSTMPDLYARRAAMDAAAIDIADWWEGMRAERLKLQQKGNA